MKYTCKYCEREMEKDKFQILTRAKEGIIKSCCKECHNEKRRLRRSLPEVKAHESNTRKLLYERFKTNHPEEYKEFLKSERLDRQLKKPQYMWTACKSRAKKEGIPFNIEIRDVFIPEYCPILGVKLEIENAVDNLYSPSIDKIIPELGYVKGNIAIISRKANMMKLNASVEELKAFSQNIINYVETNKKV